MLFIPAFLFSFEPGELEKRIISAGPGEMLDLAMDKSLETPFLEIFRSFDGKSEEEILEVCRNIFPGSTEKDYPNMIFKLGLVITLGCGVEEIAGMGIEMVFLCRQIDGMIQSGEWEEFGEDMDELDSPFWKDCVEFSSMIDPDTFLDERYAGVFPNDY